MRLATKWYTVTVTDDPNVPGQARDDRAREAALNSVESSRLLPGENSSVENSQQLLDEDRLLPGEDPIGALTEDADHWISVYSELLDFKKFMLDGAAARAAAMTQPESRVEVETTDLTVARAEAERFSRRLAFWRCRRNAAVEQANRNP